MSEKFWSMIGVVSFVSFCVGILGWTAHDSVKDREADEARRNKYIYSTDRSNCRVYTELEDFDYHPGFRKSVTLTMKNGDKFLYSCGKRYIDICNHLKVGTRTCYDQEYISEVVLGWNENLK